MPNEVNLRRPRRDLLLASHSCRLWCSEVPNEVDMHGPDPSIDGFVVGVLRWKPGHLHQPATRGDQSTQELKRMRR